MEENFIKTFYALVDVHSSAWYLFLATARWLGVVIDWICTVFISVLIFNFLAAPDRSDENCMFYFTVFFMKELLFGRTTKD